MPESGRGAWIKNLFEGADMGKKIIGVAMPIIAGGITGGFRLGWAAFFAVTLGLGLAWFLTDLAIDRRERNR